MRNCIGTTNAMKALTSNQMFIAHYPNSKVITEADMFWDAVPEGMTNLQLVLPVHMHIKDSKTGELKDAPAPTVTLGKYDAYFFENEAVAVAMMSAGGKLLDGQTKGMKVAEIIGGIDYKRKDVVEIRVDRFANVMLYRFPLDQMKRSSKSIKKSQ